MMSHFHLCRTAAILSLLALAACQTSLDDPAPRRAPRTPAGTVSTHAGSPAAAAAAEARTGVIPDTL